MLYVHCCSTALLNNAIGVIQVNQEELKLNGTQQLPLYNDDDNLLGENMSTILKKHGIYYLLAKEVVLYVNAGNTMLSCRQNNS
jgi:hypothetical protein